MSKDFATLNRDDNRIPLMTGSGIATQDSTGTPKVSPLTVSSSIITIAVPSNAAEMVLNPGANAMRISEDSTMTRYFVIPANVIMVVPLANSSNIYLVRDSVDVTLSFYFVTV